jgi:hypothetical protein
MNVPSHLNTYKSEALFKAVRNLLKHQKKRQTLQGEAYNIFSILHLTSDEDYLHSRLLGDLLNPKGTHGLGAKPLQLFVSMVGGGFIGDFSTNKVEVEIERFIGKVNLEKKSGGRLDLFVADDKGHMFTIENKIYAKDQPAQIERYVNYKKGVNKVLYLTLDGREPADESKGELINGEDYLSVSYKKDILNWLEVCQKEAYERPLLRETLKQYVNTIMKMTHRVDNEERAELQELMIEYIDEVQTILHNVSILDDLKESLRQAVINGLRSSLSESFMKKYQVKQGSPIKGQYAQLWIEPKDDKDLPTFGIETFSGDDNANIGGNLFVGMRGGNITDDQWAEMNKLSRYWPHHHVLRFKGKPINLGNPKLLKLLADQDKSGFDKLTTSILQDAVEFIEKSLEAVAIKL